MRSRSSDTATRASSSRVARSSRFARATRPNAASMAPIDTTVRTVAATLPASSPDAQPAMPTPAAVARITAAAGRGGIRNPTAAAK